MNIATDNLCVSPPWNEEDRLAALANYGILDTERDPAFDGLAELAAHIFDAPIAVVNLIADGRQWFKAEIGIGQRELPLDVSICRHAILQPGVLVVADLTKDARFADNPLVTAADGLRFYAGALIETPDGLPLGTVCVLDNTARPDGISPRQERALRTLATQVMELIARRRGEAELRASEARLAAIFTNAAVGLSEISLEGRFLRVNEELCAMLGRTRDELLAGDVASVTHKEDVPESRVRLAEVVGTGSPVSFDKRYVGPDGETVWANSGLSRLDDPEGRPQAILAVTVNLTDRRRAEEAVREQEERLRLSTEHAEIGFWDVDEVNQRLIWPPLVKAMFGISADVPVTMDDFYAGLHPDDQERTASAYAAAADPARRELYDVEYRTIGQEDGVIRWVHAKGRGVFDNTGRCLRVVGTAIDISRRKEMEERLTTLNATLELRVREAVAEKRLWAEVVESTDAMIGALAPDRTFLAFNTAYATEFERIFGVRPRPGDNLAELLAGMPEQQAAALAIWDRALSGEAFVVTEEFGDPQRSRPYYELRFNPLIDEHDQVVGAFQFAIDVTERLRNQAELSLAQEALRQSQKLDSMGQLTGGVAHDFNNLLTPIIGSLDMLQRRAVGSDRDQRMIDGALQSAERAKTLVQRLLAFARRQPLQPAPVDLRELVRGMTDLAGSTLGPQIRMSVDLQSDLPSVKADANQLEMAILNLCVNARDAMSEGGQLTISAHRIVVASGEAIVAPGDYVRLTVADTGVGMSEAVAAKAIEPFFSTKGVGKGTGLGLSMVHGLVAQLGGAMTITSRVGSGTSVHLWLPVTLTGEAGSDTRPDLPEVPKSSGTVLIVDDEEVVRMTTSDMLSDLGYGMIEAESAEAALKLIEAGTEFDILITDHLMPGMTGTELAREVRMRLPDKKVLIVSGYAESDGLPGDMPRLTKPFRQVELASAMAEL